MHRFTYTGALLLSAALTFVAPATSWADSFTWKFASPDVSGSGTLNAIPYGNPGEYEITNGSGSVTDSKYGTFSVSFLPCSNPSATCTLVNSDGQGANLTYDNLLFPGNTPGTELTDNGIVLSPGPPGSGATGLGVYDSPSQEFYNYSSTGYQNLTVPFQVTPAATQVATTPEPGSLVLLGSGMLGVFCRVRRRSGK